MTAHEIIIRPIVSERSFSGMELNKYTFEVAKDANKYQIKDAVEEIFGVKLPDPTAICHAAFGVRSTILGLGNRLGTHLMSPTSGASKVAKS